MAILVVPDVHGRLFWRRPVETYIERVNRVVFLGDYLDPYPGETEGKAEDVCHNLMDIIRLKQTYPEKVILLKGNHDEHYCSVLFHQLACSTRCDHEHWEQYHELFRHYALLFQLANIETIGNLPYVFTHAGITVFWLHLVNTEFWHMPDHEISISNPVIIDQLNQLDKSTKGEQLLAVVGKQRFARGAKTGSILWADVKEHNLHPADIYGMQNAFQIFGHSRLNGKARNWVMGKHFAMVDSQKCFLIGADNPESILPVTQ